LNNRTVELWGPVVVYMAVIFYLSSLHNPPIPSNTDKPLHWIGYVGLAVVVVRALAGGLFRWISVRTAVVAVIITVAYAATDEVHQMFVAGRSADVYDFAADAAGALAGAVACWAWGIIRPASRDEL
jgi:VanZ family protein